MTFRIIPFQAVTLLAFLFISSCSEKQTDQIEIVTLAETTKSWNGETLPSYLKGTPKITILKITIPPEAKLKLHKHLVINAGVLLKGELTVIDEDNNSIKLKEGDALVELVNIFHYGKNEGNKPAEIIVFYAGNEGVPITVIKDDE